MGQKKSAPKAAPPPTTRGGGGGGGGGPALVAACRDYAHVPLLVLGAYVLFALFLPWLAALTPPGVNMSLVAEDAEAKLHPAAAAKDCHGVCDALTCPAGWTTALSPDDPCKCICKRLETGKVTDWDLQQRAQTATAASARAEAHAAEAAPAKADVNVAADASATADVPAAAGAHSTAVDADALRAHAAGDAAVEAPADGANSKVDASSKADAAPQVEAQ